MATRTLKNVVADELTQEDADELRQLLADDTFNSDALNEGLASLFAEMGVGDAGEATVHVSFSTDKEVEANIWRGTPDDYDLESLAKKFGSGKYRVKIYVRQPTGNKVVKANKVFVWKLSAEDEARRLNPVAPSPGISATDIAVAVAEALRAILPTIIPQQVPQQQSPADMMRNTIEMMKILQPPRQEQPDTLTIMRNTMELMQAMRPEPDEAPTRGSANTNDLILAMINKFGPLAAQALGQNITAGQPPMLTSEVPLPQLNNEAPPTQTDVTPQEQEDMNIVARQKLKMGLQFLVSQCVAGGFPETYADVIINNVPVDTLKGVLAMPDPIAFLSEVEPTVNDHAVWFKEVLAECNNILTAPPEE